MVSKSTVYWIRCFMILRIHYSLSFIAVLLAAGCSFFYAGAQSIIASLWFVNDRSTSELMQAFYKNLQTMTTAEALRQAKLQIMKKYPDPLYWAPFCLQGDYR